MPLTGATIRAALSSIGAVGNQLVSMDELANGANGALRRAPGLTVQGAAAFLATCAQESAYFRTTTEYGSGQSYAPYIGRTFTQITHPGNYRAFGQWTKGQGLVDDPETFVRNPRSLGDYRWAWLGPIQYWEQNGIWRWANPGNFRAVSQAINGGAGRVGTSFTPHGWTERQKMYDAFLKAGSVLLPEGAPTPPTSGRRTLRQGDSGPDVAELQRVLAAWYPDLRLVADGQFGPATERAVETLQRNSRLAVDGIAGPATYRKLGL